MGCIKHSYRNNKKEPEKKVSRLQIQKNLSSIIREKKLFKTLFF